MVSALASVRHLLPFLTRLTAYTYAQFLLPLEGNSFGVPYQADHQGRTEKHIKCQAKARPPVRHTGVVDDEAMDVIKMPYPIRAATTSQKFLM